VAGHEDQFVRRDYVRFGIQSHARRRANLVQTCHSRLCGDVDARAERFG
jgi:hypothetical protein